MINFYCIDELDWRWDWTGKGHGIGLYNTEVLYSPKLVVVLPTFRLQLSLKRMIQVTCLGPVGPV